MDKYIKEDTGGNLFLTREVDDVSRWGIIENGIFKEKPKESTSNEASNVFFILDKELGNVITTAAKNADAKGAKEYALWEEKGKEIHHSTYLNEAVKNNPEKMKIRTYKMGKDDLFLDCGTLKGYEKALLYTLLNTSIYKKENIEFLKNYFSHLVSHSVL